MNNDDDKWLDLGMVLFALTLSMLILWGSV